MYDDRITRTSISIGLLFLMPFLQSQTRDIAPQNDKLSTYTGFMVTNSVEGETVVEAVATIEAQNLTKRYGAHSVVKDMTFRVNEGEVYALVGPNGAGKTTLIKLVSGLAFPSSGEVRLLGVDPFEQPSVRRELGAVVEAPAAFYPYMTGRENLKLHARLAGDVSDSRMQEVLDMMELSYAGNRKVGVYSLGMRQRLGVAAAMLTRPKILILDEPASGMDPLSLHLVHSVLRNAAQEGTAVMLSTHHLDEVVAYCSRVAIIEEGELIDEVNLLDRRDRYRLRTSDVSGSRQLLELQPFISHVSTRGEELIFILKDNGALGQVGHLLGSSGISLYELTRDSFNLRAYYRDRLQEQRTERQVDPEASARAPQLELEEDK